MNQNLFEKYGIKEVADVTFYRIERKEETFESLREITVSSILKSALTQRMVYPMENGAGADEGFEALVFEDAELITGRNYNCDDEIIVREVYTFTVEEKNDGKSSPEKWKTWKDVKDTINGTKQKNGNIPPVLVNVENPMREVGSEYKRKDSPSDSPKDDTPISVTVLNSTPTKNGEKNSKLSTDVIAVKDVMVTLELPYVNDESRKSLDPDKEIGTHEFTYPQQILMAFAKNQNLIDKTGTRYTFKNSDKLFGDIVFDSDFAPSTHTTERIVVVGLPNKMDATTYDIQEVLDEIKKLTTIFPAKAYNVVYNDYAELIVENEMGYYDPAFLGYATSGHSISAFTQSTEDNGTSSYAKWSQNKKGTDLALSLAKTWGDFEHESINDAIDALREQKLILDVQKESALRGIQRVYGGYKVMAGKLKAGESDEDNASNEYRYLGRDFKEFGDNLRSKYSLSSVLDALNIIALTNDLTQNPNISVAVANIDKGAKPSNRAIYIDEIDKANLAASAYIYLLTNKNEHKLSSDKDGIFWFIDKKGNKVYYQDKIFAGTKNLALVIIGDKGLIFVVNRHGTKDTEKIAWLVNENGYLTNNQCKTVVDNGLIHTIDITDEDETFDATCTVKSMKICKINKMVNRYVPVLYLDTLKVSTLEQTAEQTAAEGGKGNAQLIIWDYGKEITLTLEDALYSPASMSAMIGSYEGTDFTKGVKTTKRIDRTEKCTAKRSFIVPAGNSKGVPSEGDMTAQAVYIDLNTMKPYQDGAPIAEGEVYLKYTRSVAYGDNSLGNTIEISADKFPGTYKIVGDTFARNKTTGEDQRFQFVIPQAKMSSEQTITLEAEGDPTVFDMTLTVLRPDDGVMVKLIQYDVVENEEENDGSTMVKGTENLNLLDDAEMYRVSADNIDDENYIGATEY